MNTIDRLLMVISATRYLPPFGEEHKENVATPICGCRSVKVLGLVVRGSRLFRFDVGERARCCHLGLSCLRRLSAGEEVLVRGVSSGAEFRMKKAAKKMTAGGGQSRYF